MAGSRSTQNCPNISVGDIFLGRVVSYYPEMGALAVALNNQGKPQVLVDVNQESFAQRPIRPHTSVIVQLSKVSRAPKHHKAHRWIGFYHAHCRIACDGLQLVCPQQALTIKGQQPWVLKVNNRAKEAGIRGGHWRFSIEPDLPKADYLIVEKEVDELVDGIAQFVRDMESGALPMLRPEDQRTTVSIGSSFTTAGELLETRAPRRLRRRVHDASTRADEEQTAFLPAQSHNLKEDSLRKERIPLLCGAELVVERTEAMLVIDVNRRVSKLSAHEINVQAARVIGSYLETQEFRGLGVIDFIGAIAEEEMSQLKHEIILKKDEIASLTFESALSLGVALFARGISHNR